MIRLLHNIGEKVNSNYNTREEILNCDPNDILTFDGVYKNVFENRDVLKGRKVILFVMGKYIGKDNSFDVGMPREQYCTWEEVIQLVEELGAKVGWHSWSHRSLPTLNSEEKLKEIEPPFPLEYYAYPYGDFDEECIELVKKCGYKQAFSVVQGNNENQFALNRKYL